MPRVYDCFTFFNELDLLEIRLHELDPVVDRFVLVEATRTFSDKPKRLFFAENRERFERFLRKIVHVVVEDLPCKPATTWEREAFQRDAILRGLADARENDVLLIGDVDEIPRAEAVWHFLEQRGDAAAFHMQTFYFRLNCKNVAGEVHDPLTVAIRRRFVTTPQEARVRRHSFPGIADAGWHFSYLGDERAIREKIDAFSHQELNRPEFTRPDEVRRRVEETRDLFERPGYVWEVVPLDQSFPRYVLENQDRFARLIAEVRTTNEVNTVEKSGEVDLRPYRRLLRRYGQTSPPTLALPALGKARGRSVVDVGCGSGLYGFLARSAWHFTESWSEDHCDAPDTLLGIDFSPVAVERARRFSGYDEVLLASSSVLPLPDRSVDTALSIECMEHLFPDEVLPALRELVRVARRRIVLTTPAPELVVNVAWLQSEIKAARHDPVPLGRDEFLVLGACVHKSSLRPAQLARAGFACHVDRQGRPVLHGESFVYWGDVDELNLDQIGAVCGVGLTGYPSDGASDWRARYVELLEASLEMHDSIVRGLVAERAPHPRGAGW